MDPPLRHVTRNFPRRAAELTNGGSLYWVIGGAILARQMILDIQPTTEEGIPHAALLLDPTLVRVQARPMRAFQGWRYLAPQDAPADLAAQSAQDDMPEEMRRQLAALGLL